VAEAAEKVAESPTASETGFSNPRDKSGPFNARQLTI